MPAKFYEGASLKTTRTISQDRKVPPPQSNSMKGMPGFIKTTQDKSSGGLKDSSGMGPHREGPIGKRSTPGGLHFTGKYADNGKFRGSSDKSYRATSTGPAGKIVGNKRTPIARPAKEGEGPKRGQPRSGFKQSTALTKSFAPGGVGAGKMESLRGRAKFSMER